MIQKNNMKKNRVHIILLILCSAFLIVGCGGTKKEEYAKIEKQAKTNSIEYIQDKYGFEAEVISAKAEPNYGAIFSWDEVASGYALVTLQYDNKEFCVYISGDKESTDGKDNYQQEQIEEAIEAKFISDANIQAEEVYCNIFYEYYNPTDNNFLIMTSVYYNGSNIDEVLDELNKDNNFQVDYMLLTLNDISQSHSSYDFNSERQRNQDVLIVNCDNIDDFNIMKNAKVNPFNLRVKNYVVYMTDYSLYTYGSVEKKSINKVTGDGFVVCYAGGSYCEITSADWVSSDFNKERQQVFDSYKYDTDADNIYFFVRLDKLYIQEFDGAFISDSFLNNSGRHNNNGERNAFVNDEYITYATTTGTQAYDHVFTVLKQRKRWHR